MIRIERCQWLTVLVASALLAPASGAQETDPAKAIESSQEGVDRKAADILQDLERLRLELLGADDLAAGLSKVEALEAECEQAMSEFQGKKGRWSSHNDVLGRARYLHAHLLIALGRPEEAKALLQEVLNEGPKELVDLLEFERAMLSVQAAVVPDETSDDVRAAVSTALAAGDVALVRQLGTVAIPAIQERILALPNEFPADPSLDALCLLRDLDRRGSGAFVLEHYDAGGYLWKRRIVRTLLRGEGGMIFGQPSDWSREPECPRASKVPEWMQVFERLVEEPEVDMEAISGMLWVINFCGTTPRLRESMLRFLAVDEKRREKLLEVLSRYSSYTEEMRDVLEAAVIHPEPEIRRFAAEKILQAYEHSAPFLTRWSDPDAIVRERVVTSFGPRQIRGSTFRSPLTPEAKGMFSALVNDADVAVRKRVLDVLLERADEWVEPALFERLARDPEPEIRVLLAERIQSRLRPELCAAIFTMMANDADQRVLVALDQRLHPGNWDDDPAQVQLLLPVLEARFQSTTFPLRALYDADHVQNMVGNLMKSDVGVNWLARKGIEWSDEQLLRMTTAQHGLPILYRLETELLRSYVERLFALDASEAARMVGDAWQTNRAVASERERLFRELVEISADPKLDPALVLILASLDVRRAGPRVADAAIATMTDGRWTTPEGMWKDAQWFRDVLFGRMRSIPGEQANRILLEVVGDPDATAYMRQLAASLHDPNARNGADAVKAVMEVWLEDDTEQHSFLDRAIRSLGVLPIEGKGDVLRRLLAEGRYVEAAAEAIASSRDPSFLPDLTAALKNPQTRDWDDVLHALGSFLTDEAAEALLDVSAQVTNAEWRKAALQAVEEIRTYQEARERWASRKLGRQTREAASGELLAMLDDKDAAIRAEAARGLATLGAIEAIPRLIRLLKDPSPDVQVAAREALDRLNRMAAEEQALEEEPKKKEGN